MAWQNDNERHKIVAHGAFTTKGMEINTKIKTLAGVSLPDVSYKDLLEILKKSKDDLRRKNFKIIQ